MDRIKRVNIENLTEEQAELIGIEIGKKLSDICNEAAEKANKLLKIYGLETKIAFEQLSPIRKE